MRIAQNAIGVGFLLFTLVDGFLKLYTVRELKDKPEILKKSGMISFPIETFDPKLDKNEGDTIIRLIKEEIGFPIHQIKKFGIVPRNFFLLPDRKDIKTVYGYGLFTGNSDDTPTPSDSDIVFSGWKTTGELLSLPRIRIETDPILKDFLLEGRIADIYLAL